MLAYFMYHCRSFGSICYALSENAIDFDFHVKSEMLLSLVHVLHPSTDQYHSGPYHWTVPKALLSNTIFSSRPDPGASGNAICRGLKHHL